MDWRKKGERDEEDLGSLAGDTSCLVEDSDVAYLDRSASEIINEEENCTVHVEYHILHSVSYQVPVLYFNAAFSNGQSLVLEDIWELLSSDFVSQKADRWRLVTQQEHPYLGRPFYHIHPCHTATVMGKAMQCLADGNREEVRRKESEREESMKGRTRGGKETNGSKEVEGQATRESTKEGEETHRKNSREEEMRDCMSEEGKEMNGKKNGKGEDCTEGRNYLVTWLSTFAPVIGLDCSLEYAH